MGATSPGIAKIALPWTWHQRSEEHTSELQSQSNLVCRLLLEKKKYHPAALPFRRISRFGARPAMAVQAGSGEPHCRVKRRLALDDARGLGAACRHPDRCLHR